MGIEGCVIPQCKMALDFLNMLTETAIECYAILEYES
jgi:hypothetical protein